LVTPDGKYVEIVPATTVPLSVVEAPPSHATCCVQSPVQAMLEPHTLGCPPAPHARGAEHAGPHGPIIPPHPSPA
jgi:hypothetical protein